MRLKFLGAAQTVTGSMHLLTTDAGTLLIDCGLYQGKRAESRERNSRLPPEAVAADAVILTHAHIDHSGSIPTLVAAGGAPSVYATPATRDLCAYMLRDAARIQEGDAAYLNRKHQDDPDWQTIVPLYTEDDAIRALGKFVSVPYHKPFSPLPGVNATFIDAGHILGAAEVVLEITGRRIVFSGDLGRNGLPILRDPEVPRPPIDTLVLESTYGNRVHADIGSMHDDLERVVKETAHRGGKIVIPAFAVGRTQEIVYALNVLWQAGKLPDIPVFIDSPLSVNVTEVFRLHPDCYDAETLAFMEQSGSPFSWKNVRYVSAVEESIKLNSLRSPAIIVSSSGMCEAGRILHHLRNNCEDEKNTILIVGYQAQHTLGRRIVERRPRIKIFGVERDLRAQVVVMDAFSAHADKNDLLAYATAVGKPRRTFLVHGEPEQQEPLIRDLAARGIQAVAPAAGEEAEI